MESSNRAMDMATNEQDVPGAQRTGLPPRGPAFRLSSAMLGLFLLVIIGSSASASLTGYLFSTPNTPLVASGIMPVPLLSLQSSKMIINFYSPSCLSGSACSMPGQTYPPADSLTLLVTVKSDAGSVSGCQWALAGPVNMDPRLLAGYPAGLGDGVTFNPLSSGTPGYYGASLGGPVYNGKHFLETGTYITTVKCTDSAGNTNTVKSTWYIGASVATPTPTPVRAFIPTSTPVAPSLSPTPNPLLTVYSPYQISSAPGARCVCVPSWSCSGWSPSQCPSSRVQTRSCSDSRNCGTTFGKPAESQTCCYPNWQCSGWGSCQSGNYQTQTCTDSNNCGTTAGKPAERQYCTYVSCNPSWSCTPNLACAGANMYTLTCTDRNNCGTTAGMPNTGCTYIAPAATPTPTPTPTPPPVGPPAVSISSPTQGQSFTSAQIPVTVLVSGGCCTNGVTAPITSCEWSTTGGASWAPLTKGSLSWYTTIYYTGSQMSLIVRCTQSDGQVTTTPTRTVSINIAPPVVIIPVVPSGGTSTGPSCGAVPSGCLACSSAGAILAKPVSSRCWYPGYYSTAVGTCIDFMYCSACGGGTGFVCTKS